MKNLVSMTLLLAAGCLPLAVTRAAQLSSATIDGGGGRATSANYTIDANVGDTAGISDGNSAETVVRYGYIGRLTDIVGLTLTGTPHIVNEEDSTQLSGIVLNDDDTLTIISGGDIAWDAPEWPIASIDGAGEAVADAVYEDVAGPFAGVYSGIGATGTLWIVDVDPDNFGMYAGDGLPDGWQVQYFGIDNPDAAPDVDADGSGFTNLEEYIADTVPTNPASYFRITEIERDASGAVESLKFVSSDARLYRVKYTDDDLSDAPQWSETPDGEFAGDAELTTWSTAVAPPPTNTPRVYRIHVQLP